LQFSIILQIKNIAINSSSSTYSVMKELEDFTNRHWFKHFQEAEAVLLTLFPEALSG
jgi:hypothetical protein